VSNYIWKLRAVGRARRSTALAVKWRSWRRQSLDTVTSVRSQPPLPPEKVPKTRPSLGSCIGLWYAAGVWGSLRTKVWGVQVQQAEGF